MTRLLTCDCSFPISALWSDWNSSYNRSPIICAESGEYNTDPPRTGDYYYLLSDADYLRLDFASVQTHTQLYVGFAFRAYSTTAGNILTLYTDDPGVYTNFVAIRYNSSRGVDIRRNTSALASSAGSEITLGQWHYIEAFISPRNSGGEITVKIDGTQVATYSGDTTQEEEFINCVEFSGNTNTDGVHANFDDIVVNDENGSSQNTWPGQLRLLALKPKAAGATNDWDKDGFDFTPAFSHVQRGWGTSVLTTSDADEVVTFELDYPDLDVAATIHAVTVQALAKVDTGSGVIAPILRSVSTQDQADDQTLSASWQVHEETWDEDPATSAAWTEAALADLEAGVSS